jgi:hypothetical protein
MEWNVRGSIWRMRVQLTATEGLVLRDVRLKNRYMADRMGLDSFRLGFPGMLVSRTLEFAGQEDVARVRLVDLQIPTDPEAAPVKATYAVDRIPPGSKSCLYITQSYQFGPLIDPYVAPDERCEPFARVVCARFFPLVSYRLQGADQKTKDDFQLITEQRFDFRPDAKQGGAALLTHDREGWFSRLTSTLATPVSVVGGNPIAQTMFVEAIRVGAAADVDNFHQTSAAKVDRPQFYRPGCPECVHIHWRWSWNVNFSEGGLGPFPNSGRGQPIIPPGSKQSVAVRVEVTEGSPTFYYTASNWQLQDTFFSHGGWFSPQTELLSSATLREDLTEANRPPKDDLVFQLAAKSAFDTIRVPGYLKLTGLRAGDTFESMMPVELSPAPTSSIDDPTYQTFRFQELSARFVKLEFERKDNPPAGAVRAYIRLLGNQVSE